jgi:adenine-specific DNA-methyltransferase
VDYIVWYGTDKTKTKFNRLYQYREAGETSLDRYDMVRTNDGAMRRISSQEKITGVGTEDGHRFQLAPLYSDGASNSPQKFSFNGAIYEPRSDAHWKTSVEGLSKVAKAGRVQTMGAVVRYARFASDFAVIPVSDRWESMQIGVQRTYVVQTAVSVIERCMLMTSDPGDLVLDPTCGSGSTAYVAEKWGRRWITCDTSRVAITLAKQRLMTASFDYFALRYPHEGLKGGFIYKTVPHVTLKSIANNPEIDAIYERLHPGIEAALAALNTALVAHAPTQPFVVTDGVRKGQKLPPGKMALLEWEVPFDFPDAWPADRKTPDALTGPLVDALKVFHTARQKMQSEMDRSIASQADNETLYDQPEKTKNKLRITGPFTVEAVPFPTVLSLEEHAAHSGQGLEANSTHNPALADMSVARSGNTSRQHTWRDELLKAGIRGKGGQMLKFAELEVLPGTTCLHASGHLDTGERVVISFGPEHGALEQRQVEHALGEAGELFPRPKMIVFCAFAFDPEAAKDIDALKGITALKAQMNTDLLTEDLKKASSKATTNQSFWLMGQPDVHLTALPDGLWQVEVNGFDYFDTAKGELVSGGKGKIAAWSLDTDYDGRSLFPHQFFFPMVGKDEGWMKLKKDIRAELDEDLLKHFVGTVSLPFEAGANATVAVKIVDDRGIESLKIMRLEK